MTSSFLFNFGAVQQLHQALLPGTPRSKSTGPSWSFTCDHARTHQKAAPLHGLARAGSRKTSFALTALSLASWSTCQPILGVHNESGISLGQRSRPSFGPICSASASRSSHGTLSVEGWLRTCSTVGPTCPESCGQEVGGLQQCSDTCLTLPWTLVKLLNSVSTTRTVRTIHSPSQNSSSWAPLGLLNLSKLFLSQLLWTCRSVIMISFSSHSEPL